MKSQFDIKNIFRIVGAFIVFGALLLACTTSPETPQDPIAKPTKTKYSPTASVPNTPNNEDTVMEEFSIQNANKMAPDDVLKEISFGGTGGGKSCGYDQLFDSPTIFDTEDTFEWKQFIDVFTCGWKTDEHVQVTLSFPNGKSIVTEEQAQEDDNGNNSIWYTYAPNLDDPAGTYSFKFSGDSGIVEYELNIFIPDESRMYYLRKEKSLFLYNFYPHEKIRLFQYVPTSPNNTSNLTLAGWQEYQTDSSGQLLIRANLDLEWYGIIGDKSGMISRSGNPYGDAVARINFFNQNQTSDSSCLGALPSRLQVDKYAYVATDPPLDQRIREGAGTSYSIIGYIVPGNPMKILDGPKCADGWTWWKVQSIKKTDLIGWTSEGDDVYWLIPCQSLNSCP